MGSTNSSNKPGRSGRPGNKQAVRVGHLFLNVPQRQLLWLNDVARELHEEGIPFLPRDLRNSALHTAQGTAVKSRDLPLTRAWKDETAQEATFYFPACDGTVRQVAWTATPVRDNEGKLNGVLATVTVTSLEPDWEGLAGLSHDLRTPLQAVQLYAQLMQTINGLPEEADEVSRGLHAAADRALAVARDLLTWCRNPMRNGRRVDRIFFPLEPFLRTLLTEHIPAARQKGLHLSSRGFEEVQGWAIGSDPVRLGRLLSNLLTNAIRYTGVGRVELIAQWRQTNIGGNPMHFGTTESALARKPSLVLSVVDTGIGISREDQDSIFQPFERGREAPDLDSNASGLGLTVVERLAEELGLILEAYSVPGRGSAFDLVLPGRLLRVDSPVVASV